MEITSSPDVWVARANPNPYADVRLFCFPYAGGGSSIYRDWPKKLPEPIDVLAVKLPGRESRFKEPPFTCLVELAQVLAGVLLHYLDRPFAFFGHSVGALLAFELAHVLREKHKLSPVRLFVSANQAPHLSRAGPPIHNLPAAAFIQYLRGLNGTPEKTLKSAYMQMLLPTLRADFALSETYVCNARPPLHCAISAFGGLQDATVSRKGLSAWAQHTDRGFNLRMFQGTHFFLQEAQDQILDLIVRTLTVEST